MEFYVPIRALFSSEEVRLKINLALKLVLTEHFSALQQSGKNLESFDKQN